MKSDDKKDNLEILQTDDGSFTLLNKKLGETYHSKNGALTESAHIYINQGLKPVAMQHHSIRILEVGYGTGLNAWLSFIFSLEQNKSINYLGLETDPLPIEFCIKPLDEDYYKQEWNQLSGADWNTMFQPGPGFEFEKRVCGIENFSNTLDLFNLVYFDAFAPQYQPEIWDENIFRNLQDNMHSGAILVTYCSKGQIRRLLQSIGFEVERLPGPPGKKEMLRARKG